MYRKQPTEAKKESAMKAAKEKTVVSSRPTTKVAKILDFAAKPTRFELEHPKHGKTGIHVELVGPHSKVWRDALEIYQAHDATEAAFVDLMTASVVAWDEEAFEAPCNPVEVKKILEAPENEWLAAFIVKQTGDTLNFFGDLPSTSETTSS